MPGAKVSDGVTELCYGPKFENIDYLVIGLGTNNICNYNGKFSKTHEKEIAEMIVIFKKCYPNAKVSRISSCSNI